MPRNYRYLYGETDPVSVAFDPDHAVEQGSLCFVAAAAGSVEGDGIAGRLYAASDYDWDTDIATTQGQFHAEFVGVAMQHFDGENPKAYGLKDGKLRVATRGVFEFDCASANFVVGDLVGPAKQSGNLLEAQKVVAVATEALAVGRVVEAGTGVTRVKVRVRGPLTHLSA